MPTITLKHRGTEPSAGSGIPAGGRDRGPLSTKTVDVQVKLLDEASGSFELYAAVFGNVDRQGDVIEPGAFTNLAEFVTDGCGLLNHALGSLPVAMIDTAVQDGHGLKLTGRFHSTPEAQACRTVVRERMESGKSVKASIGYLTSDESYEKQAGRMVRHIKALSVYEFSFVNLPANPAAAATSVKSVAGESIMPKIETEGSLIEALKEFLGTQKKSLSKSGMTRLKAFAEAMDEHGVATGEHAKAHAEHGKLARAMAKEMKAFLKDFTPEGDDPEPKEPDDTEAKKKTEKPEDTADGNPPKTGGPGCRDKKDATLTVYTETLKHRSLLGRRHQSCP